MPAANTDKFKKLTNNYSSTLSSPIADAVATSFTPVSVSLLPTDTATVFVVDRVDASGNKTPSKREYILGIVSGGSIVSCLRGQGNSTAQAHSSGAVVEQVVDQKTINDIIDGLLVSLNQDGTIKTGVVGPLSLTTALQQGWQAGSGTWTFASATTFTVPAADAALMSRGTKIWLTQTTSKYFEVLTISGATVTVASAAGHTVANAAITSPYFSNVTTPFGLPIGSQSYSFRAYQSANQSITLGTLTKIQFQTKAYDPSSSFDNTTNYRYTAKVSGTYHFSARTQSVVGTQTQLIVFLMKNGSEHSRGGQITGANPGFHAHVVSDDIYLTAGDYVEVNVYVNPNTANLATGIGETYFSGHLVERWA